MVEGLLVKDGRLRLCWLGNNGWLIGWDGHLVATDLDFFLPERMLPQVKDLPELAAALSYLFITHAHTDHFNPQTVEALMAGGSCQVVLPESCRTCAQAYGLDEARLVYVRPGLSPLDEQNNPLPLPPEGGAVPGLPDWLDVRTLRALHGHLHGAVYGGANPMDCGYVLRLGGYTVVQPGDSVLLQEHLALAGVDVLLVSPTEHNMGVAQAQVFVETVQPRRVFAQHFGTYREEADNRFWTHGYPVELGEALSAQMQARYTVPEYAKVYELPAKAAGSK